MVKIRNILFEIWKLVYANFQQILEQKFVSPLRRFDFFRLNNWIQELLSILYPTVVSSSFARNDSSLTSPSLISTLIHAKYNNLIKLDNTRKDTIWQFVHSKDTIWRGDMVWREVPTIAVIEAEFILKT